MTDQIRAIAPRVTELVVNTGRFIKNERLKLESSHVSIKKDSSLVSVPVVTGMSDETKVQVIAGLSADEEVVTGYEVMNAQKNSGAKTASSPFMPKPPGGNNKNKNQGPPPQ